MTQTTLCPLNAHVYAPTHDHGRSARLAYSAGTACISVRPQKSIQQQPLCRDPTIRSSL
ncbi:MAG: hypothetical protein IJU51_07080 [Clostridia bacterium]|nr:hypothetical protein [Clostridia bacterium]